MEHSWLRVAAMVVSEMKERLSPKKAPPTIAATTIASGAPVPDARPDAMGTSATMVPTLVPIAMEMKHAATKSPTRMKRPGSMCRVAATTASMLPMAFAVAAKTPASTNIHIISNTLLLPAPREKTATRSSRPPLVMRMA